MKEPNQEKVVGEPLSLSTAMQNRFDKARALENSHRYNEAIRMFRPALTSKAVHALGLAHYVYICISDCYYKDHQYTNAVRNGRKAAELAPHCLMSQWLYAAALEQDSRVRRDFPLTRVAIERLQVIARWHRRPTIERSCGCGQTTNYVKTIRLEAVYRVALAEWTLGNHASALAHMNSYIAKRRRYSVKGPGIARAVKERLTLQQLVKGKPYVPIAVETLA
jgi:hypothetical protein